MQKIIRIYNEEHIIDIEKEESILQAAIAAGLSPPYNCQIGACGTCRAKLVKGKVQMDNNDALVEFEINQGIILTCQSHLLTDDIIVDYDDV